MIKVCGHRVMVKPKTVEKMSPGGIVLPESAAEQKQRDQQTGELISIGPTAWKGFEDGTPWAEIGDLVMFSKYGGKIIFDGSTEYRILNDEDIVAIVDDNIKF